MKKLLFVPFLLSVLCGDEFYYSNGKKVFLKKSNLRDSSNLYTNEFNATVEVTDKILVKFRDISKIDEIFLDFNLTLIEKLSDKLVLFKTDDNIFDIANRIYELEYIEYSHPDFKIQKSKRTLDPLYKYAWHLENTAQQSFYKKGADINITGAWAYTKGSGVKVGIVDEDGFDIYHEDLSENFLEGYNSFYKDSVVTPSGNNQNHGTACMGLLIAKENNVGSVGVAPESKIYSVKDNSSTSDLIKGFQWLRDKGVDVISNSWGTYNVSDSLKDIIDELAINGRNGKGITILFASGNSNYNLDNDKYNDESELESVIGIGASSEYDTKASYSNYGSNIDILSPGSQKSTIVTTDRMGNSGYSSSSSEYPNYTFDFDGTSAAAPIASGVVALMLGLNSDLTRNEIQEILQLEADKIGDVNYTNGKNLQYGYGRINAGKSVKRAFNLKNSLVTLNSGWNLIALPNSVGISDKNSPSVETIANSNYYNISMLGLSKVWIYENELWKSNSTYLSPYLGIWIHSDKNRDINLSFGSSYKLDIDSLKKGVWHLVGSGESFNTSDYTNIESIWRYESGYWELNPKTVLKSQGFWIKLREE